MRVNIIGGGLAGTALAYILKQRGVTPVIYEASSSIASGASGNRFGLYNPRFSAQMDVEAQFYSEAFFEALEVFKGVGDSVDWTPCGVLSLLNIERKDVRFRKTADSWGWSEDDMVLLSAAKASEVAGIELEYDALYLPRSGYVSPEKLCAEYSHDVEVNLDHEVKSLNDLEGDATVIACGMGALNFEVSRDLPLKAVRGQVSYIEQSEVSKKLKSVVSYSGYIMPANSGVHALGATFQPWFNHSDILDEDDLTNLEALFEAVPSVKGEYNVANSRASVRTTSRNHFPIVGQLGRDLYISVAHGSHGILSTLKSANILSDIIIDSEADCSKEMLKELSPERFF